MAKLAIFVDGSNTYMAARKLQLNIDWRRVLQYFSNYGDIVGAYYYTAMYDDKEDDFLRKLVDHLDYNGWVTVIKSVREYTQIDGSKKIKGNMDLDLGVQAMELREVIDHAVIMSGDGDFCCLVEALQRKGVIVTVVSTKHTQPPMVSDDLRRSANNFFDLKELRPNLQFLSAAPPKQIEIPDSRPKSLMRKLVKAT